MRRLTRLVWLISVLWAASAAGQQPLLLRDINTQPLPNPSSSPSGWVSFQGNAYFAARTAATGKELFRSGGTAATTTLVVDANPGPGDGLVGSCTVAGNLLYFETNDQASVYLWRTDGTAAGTWKFTGFTSPSILGTLGNILLFVASTPTSGGEVWRTDGTPSGTRLVKDINVGIRTSFPMALGVHGGHFYFSADDGIRGNELWRTDGTAQGTQLVADLEPGQAGSGPTQFGSLGTFFCFHTRLTQPPGVWRSDGTAQGTQRIASVNTWSAQSLRGFAPFNGRLCFVAPSSSKMVLWATDGTTAGTGPIPGSPEQPWEPTVFSGALYFVGTSAATGYELWKFDGSTVQLVIDMVPGPGNGAVGGLSVFNNALYFSAEAGSPSQGALWKTNGTAAGTVRVKDFGPNAPGVTYVAAAAGRIWFAGDDGLIGDEPYVSDGTTAGTRLVVDLHPSPPGSLGSNPFPLADHFGTLLFTADDGQRGWELWRTDGTAAGTTLLKEMIAGPQSTLIGLTAATVGNRTFFMAGGDLWVTDGTAAGTRLVRRFTNPSTSNPMAVLGDWLLFAADDPVTGWEVWRSDGTSAGTIVVKDIRPGTPGSYAGLALMVRVGPWVFFDADDGVTGTELWRTDGTLAGTTRVKDIQAGLLPSFPGQGRSFQGALYFVANDGATGRELWRSDGTAAGTYLVKDTVPGRPNGPWAIDAAGGKLFMVVGVQPPARLWVSDGTSAGTRPINSPVEPMPGMATLGNYALFTGKTPAAGLELWRSDGSDPGTVLVSDIFPGPTGSGVFGLTASGSRFVYFEANDGTTGSELWVTDGSMNGTRLVADLNPGAGSSHPQLMTVSAGRLLFAADDGQRGSELWRLDPGACSSPVGHGCGGGQDPTLAVTDPVIGQIMVVSGRQAVPNTVGFVLVSPILRPGIRLAPGCYSYIDPGWFAVLTAFVPSRSSWQVGIPLPNAPALIGVPAAMQAFFAPTVSPIGIDFTNGVHLRLGR